MKTTIQQYNKTTIQQYNKTTNNIIQIIYNIINGRTS